MPETDSRCPYCKKELNPKPTRAKKCPHCQELFRVSQDKTYTEDEWIARVERTQSEPSIYQLALMIQVGISISKGCTSDEASKLLYDASIRDPTDDKRDEYISVVKRLEARQKAGESIDNIIAQPKAYRRAWVYDYAWHQRGNRSHTAFGMSA